MGTIFSFLQSRGRNAYENDGEKMNDKNLLEICSDILKLSLMLTIPDGEMTL